MSSVFDNDNGDVSPRAIKVDPPSDSDTKPKRGRPKGSINASKVAEIEEAINGFLAIPAMFFASIGDQYCAWVLAGEDSPGRELAKAWAKLAKTSPQVRKVLLKLIEGGAWGGVVSSSIMVALPIAAHHGALPERFNLIAQMLTMNMPQEFNEE